MPKYLSSVFVLFAIACGGATDTVTQAPGGSDAGGASNGGHAGKASAGKSSGGSDHGAGSSAGGSTGDAGSINTAGSIGIGGSLIYPNGGTGPVDPSCPPTRPPAPSSCDDAGISCQYDFSGCLCFPTPPGTFTICQRVDPTCIAPTVPPMPAPNQDSGSAGFGGISAKIAVPPKLVCSCSAEQWVCTYGP